MSNKVTTRDLISDIIDLETQIEYCKDAKEREGLQGELVTVKQAIEKKMKNLDIFDFELTRKKNLLQTEIDTYLAEAKRLKEKQIKIDKIKKFFDHVLIPMVVKEVGKDGKYETDKKRYTLYKTYGALEITDQEIIDSKYKKMKMEQFIDKKEARKDAIEADKKGEQLPGLTVNKIERVRKS
tara:strand:- start:194 stop:739 length:546 start_codon:yes stop_codon:yes gene_type:complete